MCRQGRRGRHTQSHCLESNRTSGLREPQAGFGRRDSSISVSCYVAGAARAVVLGTAKTTSGFLAVSSGFRATAEPLAFAANVAAAVCAAVAGDSGLPGCKVAADAADGAAASPKRMQKPSAQPVLK